MIVFQSFRNLYQIPELRIKILYTAFFLIIFRLGSYIPIPGIDLQAIKTAFQDQGGLEDILLLFSTLTGGALSNFAIFSLGIMPYISASIIFSLLVKVLPSLEALSKEGASGHRKINEYTRYATVPLCLIQSYMIVRMFKSWTTGQSQTSLFLESTSFIPFEVLAVVSLTAGAIFLMWLGEQITEYGIGNGISLLIMTGIISRMPHQILNVLGKEKGEIDIVKFILIIAIFVLVIAAVIYMTYGQRKITVQQAKHTKGRRVYGGQKHSLPLKVNQAGVMPVIFASSLMVFPIMIASILTGAKRGDEEAWFSWGSFWYIFIYILFIYFFSYFWTSLMFQPKEMANQLKEYGSFIPGIRPGQKTEEYLDKIMMHITFVGAAFLAIIALIPQMMILGFDIKSYSMGAFISNMGGTSILIVVGVILDIVQKLESHLLVRNYDGFTKKGRMRGR
jgi:preprotein translocase subunit SecY